MMCQTNEETQNVIWPFTLVGRTMIWNHSILEYIPCMDKPTHVYIYICIFGHLFFFFIRYKLQAKTLCGKDWVYLSCQSPSSVRSLGFEAGPVAWWGIVYHNIFCYTYMYNHIHIYNYASSSYVNSKHVSSITLQFQV